MARRQAVIVAVAMTAFASIAAGFEHRPVQANTVDESDQVAEMLDAPAFTPLVPARLLETRSGQPTGTIDGLHQATGPIPANTTYQLRITGRASIPTSATAVALNITATQPNAPGHLTVYPCTSTSTPPPTASNLNYTTGQTIANAVITSLGTTGTICIHTAATTHLIIDINGYFPAPTAYTATTPSRLLETRSGQPTGTIDGLHQATGPIPANTTYQLRITGRASIPTSATAVALNITATQPNAPGHLTVYPCTSTNTPPPTASNLNYTTGQTIANAVITSLGTTGTICIHTAATTHLIIDINGYFPAPTAYTATTPSRLLETRSGQPTGTIDGLHQATGPIPANTTYQLRITGRASIPTSATAVALNITATQPNAPGHLTVYPCTSTSTPPPTASNLNYTTGQTIANAVITSLGTTGTTGTICIHTAATTHLIIDINGYFPAPTTTDPLPVGHPRIYLPGAQARLSGLLQSNAPTATRFRNYADARRTASFDSLYNSNFHMWYFALLANLTGDSTYCTKAVAGIEWFVAAEEARIAGYVSGDPSTGPAVGYDSYLEVGPLVGDVMMVYDWCFAQVSASQRTRWLAYAEQAVWNVWHPDDATWNGRAAPWSGWSIDNPSNNYYYSFLRATMLLGLGGEGERAAQWRTMFRTDKIERQLVPTFNSDLVGGGSREGTGYGTAMMRLWEIYDIWEASTGENISALTGHTRASLLQHLHTIVPTRDRLSLNGDHSRDSTATLFDYHRHYTQGLARLLPGDALAGRAKRLYATSTVPRMQNGFMIVYDFLYDTSTIADQPVEALNTAYHGSGVGQVFARSDWSTGATWLNFTAGPYTESHAHRDQGSFLLYKNDWMAIDPNYFSHSGIRQEEELHNLVRITDSSGATVRQREGASSTMEALRQGSGWLHVAADTTAVYTANSGAPVQLVERELVYVAPDVLVVYDRVTTSPGTEQRWQLNTPTMPAISGSVATVTNGSTTMRIERVISPTAASSVADWSGDGDISDGYRLDTVAAGGTHTYLHVISFANTVTSAVRSDQAGRQGVVISTGDGRTTTVRFSPTGVDGTLSIVGPGATPPITAALVPGVVALPEIS